MKIHTPSRPTALALLVLLLQPLFSIAQTKTSYKTEILQEFTYHPAEKKGASGRITVKVVYDAFMGSATVQALAGKFQPGDYFYYNNQCYAFAALPEEVRKKFRLTLTDICYDIQDGGRTVSTVCKKNLIDWDMAGSPSWSSLFPGLSADQAKELYKRGFRIANLRITNASFSYPSDLSKYLSPAAYYNGPLGTSSASGGGDATNLPDEKDWEAVKYFRRGDTVYILHNDGRLEKLGVCGGSVTGNGNNNGNTNNNANSGNTGNTGNGTTTRLLSPFYNGSTIVWGEKQANGRWKIVERNSNSFREVNETDYQAMRRESQLAADKLDGDWDEIVGNAAKARLSPKYPSRQVVQPGGIAPQRWEPVYNKMIVLRVFDGRSYADGIKQSNGNWLFMESNGYTFSIDERTFREMVAQQRKDLRY